MRQIQDGPANRISKKLLDEFPAPVIVDDQHLTATALIASPVSVDQSTGLERIDYNSRDGLNRIMGRVAVSRLSRPNFIWSPYKDFVSGLNENTLGVAVSYIRALRPGLMNEAKLGRTSDDIGWNRPHPEIPTLLVPDSTGTGPLYLPGSPAFYSYSNQNRTWEILDNLTWTHGRHVITAGGGALLRSSMGYLRAGREGLYDFRKFNTSPIVNFILDQPQQLLTSVSRQPLPNLQQPDFNREYRYKQYFLFAQDTFRVTSRLTLNYGLRFEDYGAPNNTGAAKDAQVQLGAGQNFEQRLASAQLVYPRPGDEQLYKADHDGWAPRFGFSYDLLGNARTLVRGAYGLFYDRPYDNLWQNVRNNNFALPYFPLRGAVNYLAPISQELKTLSGTVVVSTFPNLTLFDQSLKNAYVHSYFFGIQQRIRDNWTVEVNTLGSLGRKLITTDIVNRNFTPNPDLDQIAYRSGQGLSDYNALTAVARYRAGRKQFQISYTWSHTIDDQSEPLAGDFFNLLFTQIGSDSSRTDFAAFSRQFDSRGDRGNSDFDQRHNLVFLSIWDLPPVLSGSKAGWLFRDWRVSQLAAFRSGFPYSVREPIVTDLYNGRADVIDSKNAVLAKPLSVPGGELLLNAAAFAQSPDGVQGNTGRNAFHGPGLYNIDISLSRSLPLRWLGEAGRLTFRADAFNFLNHANLNNPQPLINDPDFGVARFGRQGIASGFPAVSPFNETARQVQLILRLEF
jgi:hypothetical protein